MSPAPFRILVTGSRNWTNKAEVERVLLSTSVPPNSEIVIVSGACPTGGDQMAEMVAAEQGWEIERHPAQWDRWGKSAGPIRNQDMVDLGANLCIAFILTGSKGAHHCSQAAMKAGIPTVVIREP